MIPHFFLIFHFSDLSKANKETRTELGEKTLHMIV